MSRLKCLSCFHCKTRVFRSKDSLLDWCNKKDYKPKVAWLKNLDMDDELALIWCENNPAARPRILQKELNLTYKKPFIENCRKGGP